MLPSVGHEQQWRREFSLCSKLLLQSPEVQVQVLGLQNVYGRPRGPYVNGPVGGSEPRQGRIRGGQDVVNAKLDLWLRFPLLGGVGDEVVLLGARPWPLWVRRADGGVGFRAAGCRYALIAVALQRVERDLSWITETDFHVPPAPATPEISIFKKVEHGFTAGGESPVVPFSFLVALCPRNLRGI